MGINQYSREGWMDGWMAGWQDTIEEQHSSREDWTVEGIMKRPVTETGWIKVFKDILVDEDRWMEIKLGYQRGDNGGRRDGAH